MFLPQVVNRSAALHKPPATKQLGSTMALISILAPECNFA
jgi:hypothetical protein